MIRTKGKSPNVVYLGDRFLIGEHEYEVTTLLSDHVVFDKAIYYPYWQLTL
jgi:hypothetical protein